MTSFVLRSLQTVKGIPRSHTMGSTDVWLQTYAKLFLLPCVLLLIAVRLSRRQLRKLYSKSHAWTINRMASFYNARMDKTKEELFGGLHEQTKLADRRITILEVGAGGGANFKYYPKNCNILCLDPNPEFERYVRRNAEQWPEVTVVESVVGAVEDMSTIPSGSVDAVVATLVLCSVVNIDGALKEIRRVLRQGGVFYFLEHVAADENTWLFRFQRLLSPINRFFLGCELTKKTWTSLENANFSKLDQERFYVDQRWFVIKPHLMGKAIK